MRTLLFAAAALLAAAPALAGTPGEQRVTDRGTTHVYSVRQLADRQIIEGRSYPSGTPFRLVVRNGDVTGTVGRVPVSFHAPVRKDTPQEIQIAAR